MKKLVLAIPLLMAQPLMAQITLKECVVAGLANRATIRSAKTEQLLSTLKTVEAKAKYLPQISLTYDYRYNLIIATQFVPVGQFSAIPTDEVRAIQFGTKWQQNAGIGIYQPLVDLMVQSRIGEAKLNEALADTDLQKAEEDLMFEIAKTYSRIISLGYRVNMATADTLRSAVSLATLASKHREGNVPKTELNQAQVNHNNNLIALKKARAALVNEEIYLHFLTNLPLERMLDGPYAEMPAGIFAAGNPTPPVFADSIPEYRKLALQEKLLERQIRTQQNRYIPTLGLEGFLGANQFSKTFNPFLNNSWFGNSYVGLSLKLPLFSPDASINPGKQLRAQLAQTADRQETLMAEKSRDLLQADTDIRQLQEEILFTEQNVQLLTENLTLYRDRLQNGQFAASDLNVQESELQKLSRQLQELNAQLNEALVKRLYIAGVLGKRLRSL